MRDLVLAFLAVAGGCRLLGLLAPSPAGSLKHFMTLRGLLMALRAALVVAVVAAGCLVLRARPWAVAAGSIAGWMAAAGYEAWRQGQRNLGGRG